jgi:bifunctional DNA-binding transcriptional regulator/antitoxin component of YhaV-PrlF toxin-antitoxin module
LSGTVFGVHHATITKSGQLSVPAPIRHRWKARKVSIVDLGDRIIVSPLPDDPIAALRGAFAGRGISSEELRRQAREEERQFEEARWARLLGKPEA